MITDENWSALQTIYQMPDESRADFSRVIDLYNRFDAAKVQRKIPSAIRTELRKIAESARDLESKLLQMSPDAILRLTEHSKADSQLPKYDALRHIERRSNDVAKIAEWLEETASSTPDGYRDAENKTWFVRKVDEIIFRHTKKNISRSYKYNFVNYITLIGKLCEPPIGAGSVEEAMKVVIRNSGDTGDDSRA